ncbi:ABC transporter ATP-binding protein [Streptomyces calidiresistens]|uniref:ABC-type xenobiotic transporter n=1 Tax=Streptomyces calidiresistens TaxID=1485586 RepID=A0A7W3XXG7_9ACTN|nr:ABC transporter ATP-binding protein [Streptomyces calidiresistens]MBB0231080.1 ATP-binding cassette domain-containing protein [Streptomyces calidiresistens]
MPTIEVRGLRKTYGTTVAVDHIDLDVAEGEILGILGPNGSGKTTTVECVAGLRRPDAGSLRVAGLTPGRDRDRLNRIVGVQLQQAGLQAKLTVREALELYSSFYEHPADGVALAERLSLGPKLDTRYGKLSGGQQQRLAIALALVGRPRVALLDELSTGLDPRSRRTVWEVVEDARAEGTTVLLVTHLMEEAQYLCDRVALFDRGRIVALDTPEGVVSRTRVPTVMSFFRTASGSASPAGAPDTAALAAIDGVERVRVREDGRIELGLTDEAVPEVLDRLAAEGIRPGRLRVVDATLDDAFLNLTSASADGTGAPGTGDTTEEA